MADIGFRLVRTLVIGVLAASLSALMFVGSTDTTAGNGSGATTDLTDIRLAAVQADAIYLSVSGFTGGDSTEPKHLNMATVNSVSAGVVKATVGSRATPEPFIINKPIDAFTPQFSLAVNSGRTIQTVSLYFNNTDGAKPVDVLAYTLSNVLVTRSAEDVGLGDSIETVRLSFTKLSIIYRKVSSGGAVTPFTYCWDYVTESNCAN